MAKKTKKSAQPTQVGSVEHNDKRVNIPTDRQTHLVSDNELAELRYPRDPSLDPQLVWKGKDETDSEDLAVTALPIFIQEKIDPKALVENLRDTAGPGETEPELTLFDDFDGTDELDALEKVDFYQHEGNWQNRMILGDGLRVMASLAEKENLRGKVQMVYFDPPYGIKFGSNWQVSTRKARTSDTAADASREPEVVKAFRDTWAKGINSYLTYLRDRVMVARDLLTETGSLFVQIGDENSHLVRNLLDEVFGSENFCANIAYQKTTGAGSPTGGTSMIAGVFDMVLWYAKDKPQVKYRQLYRDKEVGREGSSLYTRARLPDGTSRPLSQEEKESGTLAEGLRAFGVDNLTSASGVDKTRYPVEMDGRTFRPDPGVWKTHAEGMERLKAAGRVHAGSGKNLGYIRYIDDFPASPLNNVWTDTVGQNQYGGQKNYVVQTANKVVQRCVLMATDPGDLVIDPTCGSGTTAYVSEQWGRRWITIDTSRVAMSVARTRLMAARFPSYLLTDSVDGAAKETEITGVVDAGMAFSEDVRKGFVCRRFPHVTLRSIANNPDIGPGMSQDEIDQAIIRHAEPITILDQPYENRRSVRVSGRFTLESLSPYRNLDPDASQSDHRLEGDVQFETLILDNLRKSGVQNTKKNERLEFERLDPIAGEWLQAEGEYKDKDGIVRHVALSIGSEYGTVGPEQIALAAQEATRGVPYDLLLIIGYAFDPAAWATAIEVDSDTAERKVGRLQTLLVRANTDLTMGDELLKKTGSGNLFVVFGEPDVQITPVDGQVTVEIIGLDVYDPTSGQVRSSSTDDLAAWFIDTNYDGTSFFVRHAYFTGADKPYEALAKTLRSEINADAWESLYSTISRPFDPPETGKIAIKVINHYGDEILQVYEVPS